MAEVKDEPTVTPWEVKGKIDYMNLIDQFGTNPITAALIKRWEQVTGTKAHRFLRRGLVFSHQDINKILDDVEAGNPVYIYTGRGPSSESMHLGHMVPFLFTKYLQDALNCIVIIQMSDDEKFLFKNGSNAKDLNAFRELSYKNARDIIACGFDMSKTYIFSNLEANKDNLYFNNVLIMKATSMSQVRNIYGLGESLDPHVVDLVKQALLTEEDNDKKNAYAKLVKNYDGREANNVGQCVWPCFQCGPAFCTSFTNIFTAALIAALESGNLPEKIMSRYITILNELNVGNGQSIRCLVPMAIDQAPYFRMARDVAGKLNCPKPAVIHSEFLPGLKQSNGKMSSTDNESATIFLDMDPKKISKTIKKYAFSGGGQTVEEHRQFGGNIKVDICYQYLTYFLESDDELKRIATEYTNGTMLSGDLKTITANLISELVGDLQQKRNALTEQDIKTYFDPTRIFDIGGCYNRDRLDEDAANDIVYGIEFDRTFGLSLR